jgi:alpha-tubulin suppressor-like RCC1 family protein
MLVIRFGRVARAVLLATAVATACGDDTSGPTFDADAPAVYARSTFDSVFVGRTARLFAIATGDSATVAWPRFQWSSADSTIARVDSLGTVFGVSPGRVWVRAELNGLLDSTLVSVGVPVVRGEAVVLQVALGGNRQCALLSGGVAACLDTLANDSLPTLVPLAGATTVALEELSTSASHTCGLAASGELYCWGANGLGEHLNGRTGAASTTPVRAGGSTLFSAVSVGTNYTCGTERITLLTLCAGTNTSRQLGRATSGNRDTMPASITQGTLSSVRGSLLSNSNGSAMCLVSNDDKLVCWGGGSSANPALLNAGPAITGVARGAAHTCAVNAAGLIRCNGTNAFGQLGDGTINEGSAANFVVSVLVQARASFVSVAAADNYTCALSAEGQLFCWGDFPNARLRAAYGTSRRAPVLLLSGVRFTSINATRTTLCGVTTQGSLVCL